MNELVKAVGAGLDHLLTLPVNWNCEGADRIGEDIVADVREFVSNLPASVPAPLVFPTSDGGVKLEWVVNNSVPIEFEFVPFFEGRVEYLIENPLDEDGYTTGDFDLGDIGKAMELIMRFVDLKEDEEIDHDPFYGDGD